MFSRSLVVASKIEIAELKKTNCLITILNHPVCVWQMQNLDIPQPQFKHFFLKLKYVLFVNYMTVSTMKVQWMVILWFPFHNSGLIGGRRGGGRENEETEVSFNIP